jgi:hypothetical protein
MPGTTAAACCTLSEAGTVTIVKVRRKCTVCYEFDTTATSADLALRYLVVVDGSVVRTNGDKALALDGNNRKIMIAVDPGSKVALFLNSDAHPDFRRKPVYAVQVGENDVHVKITERKGRIGHESSVLPAPNRQRAPGSDKLVDVYDAALTGDIWMSISNLYTENEADAMLPEDTDNTVRAAVRRIYKGLPSQELVIQFPASDSSPKHTLRLRFDEPDNVLENTTHCPLLTGILPRTHPRAYAALLTEARAAGVTMLRVTSGWRPMLGSIVHRAGLGLDINYAESETQRVDINRASLSDANAKRNENVSGREQVLYAEYEQAKEVLAKRTAQFAGAQKQLAATRDPKDMARFQELANTAKVQADDSKAVMDAAEYEWNRERDLHEPKLIRTLRGKLTHNASINKLSIGTHFCDVAFNVNGHPCYRPVRRARPLTVMV